MKLSTLLTKLERYLPECDRYAVVAFHPTEGENENPNIQHIVSLYVDDAGSDIILQTADATPDEAAPLTLGALRDRLVQLQSGRADHAVECSDQGPDARWRLDCPVSGFGVNSASRMFAFLW